MLHLGHGNPSEAWQDLLACHRLGRHLGRGGTLIEGLVSLAICTIAVRGEAVFLAVANPDAKTLEGCLLDLYALPKVRIAAEQIDIGERFWSLDGIVQVHRHGISFVPVCDDQFQPIKHGLSDKMLNGIDWNAVLEITNDRFAQIGAAFAQKDRATRVLTLAQMSAETRPYSAQFVKGEGGAALNTAPSSSERGHIFGQMFFAISMSSFMKVHDAVDRTQQHFDILTAAYALVWYQRANGRYPDSLAKLAPEYLTAVPVDVFSGKELVYRPDANGFLLYSVGVNGIDEGGRWADDKPPGDDIAVRIPLPPKP